MKKTRGRALRRTTASAFLFGMLFSVIAFFAAALIFALISASTENPTGNIGMISLAALFSSGAISGIATSRYKGEGGVIPALLSSLFFAIVLLAVGLIAKGGEIPSITLLNLAAYVAISTVFAAIGKKREKRRRR